MLPITPEGGLALALTRGLAVACLLSAFGSLLFRRLVLPKVVRLVPAAADTDHAIRRLAQWSLAAAVPLLLAWCGLQTADLAQTPGSAITAGQALAAWPVVVTGTLFGQVWLAQLFAVIAAWGLLARWPGAALATCTVALLLQAGHSHALSIAGGPSLLLASDVVHLAAAGAWLGGLAPLLLVVRGSPPQGGALAARWYSPLGKWCVAGLVLSAIIQFWALVGGLPGLVGTAYGSVAAAKLGLLAVLLGFAVLNRYRLAPALRRPAPNAARRTLIRSVAVQTGFGLAAVLAAGLLSELPPSLHEQPLWPFALRPSLVTMAEPELAAEVWTGVALAAAAACLLAGLAWGRLRRGPGLVLLPAAAALAWFALPHLSLLLVEAYPTSYYASPTNFAATSIMRGAGLYPANCASCHGDSGRGDGPAAASLAVPPADLTAAHLWEHADGEMFWWLTHGIPAPDGTSAMPGFAAVLSPDQRWNLIDAVRARNAGTAQRKTGEWPRPVAVPEFPLACPGQDQAMPETMRGRVLYLVAGLPGAALPADDPAMTTVLLTRGQPAPGWTGCVASDPAAWDALALLTGQTPDGFQGTRLLVDAEGWLRTVKRAGAAEGWNDPAALRTDVQTLRDHPLAAAAGGHHH